MRSDLLSNHLDTISLLYKIFTMLLLCTGGSPLSYLFPSTYKGLFLVCLKVLRFLFIRSLFNQSFHLSDVELQLMDVADDILTHVEICLVYWNK
jgi:hypothetical protein